jgi:hypothetical protein
MHTYRLSVARDFCHEKSKDLAASIKSSDRFSPEKKPEKTLLVKTKNLEDEKNSLIQELEMVKKSEESNKGKRIT